MELAAMPKYEAYKDSGVDWIGAIPSHWKIAPLRYLSKIQTGNTPSKNIDSYYSKQEGIPWIKPDELKEFKAIVSSNEMLTKKGEKEGRIISSGSILVCCIGTIGKIGVAGCNITTNQQINSVTFLGRVDTVFSKFLMFSASVEHEKLANGNVVRILNTDTQKSIFLPVPRIKEQTAIANFLDKKTAQIDEAITIKKKQIELLKERKQILIQKAVTQGLDPNVPMRDSGVDWIGEVPEHWEVFRLKMGCHKITDGAHISPDLSAEIHPFVSTVNVNDNGSIDFENCIYTSQSCYDYLERTGCSPQNGDVLFSKDGTVGRTAIVDSERDFVIASSLVIIRPKKQVFDPRYLDLVLSSKHIKKQTDTVLSGSALRRISIIKVSNLLLFKISLEEQLGIIEYCTNIKSKIVKAIEIQQTQIQNLKEYKTTLINSAVTGKIKVPSLIKQAG